MVQIIKGKKPKKLLKRIEEFSNNKETDFAYKVCQNFKLLLTQKGLFSDIEKFRKKWVINIPINTIITDSSIETEEKVEAIPVSSLEDLVKNPSFQAMADRIAYQMKHPPTDEEIEERDTRFNDLNDLMKKYKIPSICFNLFKSFAYCNTIPFYSFKSDSPTGANFFISTDADGNPCMAIRIFPETTTEDIIAEWPNIEISRDKFLGYNLQKQLDRKNIDRDLRIIQLKYCKKNITVIAKQINLEFPTKTFFTYQEVNRVVYEINQFHANKPLVLP